MFDFGLLFSSTATLLAVSGLDELFLPNEYATVVIILSVEV